MPPKFDPKKCTNCGECVDICPMDILRDGPNTPSVAYPDECWHCGACMIACTTKAIKMNLPLWMRPVTVRKTEK